MREIVGKGLFVNYSARDSIDLVATSIDATHGIVEHAIVGEHLVNPRAPARGSFSPKTSSRLRVSKVDM